jgi:hypothetical protein
MRRSIVRAAACIAVWLFAVLGGVALVAGPRSARADGPIGLPHPPARETVTPFQETADVPPQDPPTLPDLTILHISRSPRYAAYKVDYPGGIPTLRAGNVGAQRRPTAGETVTLTAAIKNQGILDSPAVAFQWTLDGETFAAGALPALAAGEVTSLTTTWEWSDASHQFELAIDLAGALEEISEENNRRGHQTDALFLAIDVHPFVYEEFARRPNLVGSWSFEDWVQAQVAQMNERLAGAAYPLTPDGILDRVRIDQIRVLPEEDGLDVANHDDLPEFDGRWIFGVAEDDHHTPVDERRESAENYARNYAGQIDWGLVHELTHQLGVIDLYRLALDGAVGNPLVAADGRALLLGRRWPNPGLMGGGETTPYDDGTYYSSHTARGLNSHAGYRRGYYGDYLFDLPAQTVLQVLDNRGLPAAGAQIDIFQTAGDRLDSAPVVSGVADAAGQFELPNRPIAGGDITTATGHTLSANPFGLIDVVGTNGLLLARVRSPASLSHEEFQWIPLTDLNLARWSGIAERYTVIVPTHLSPGGLSPGDSPPPAPALSGDAAGSQVQLRVRPIADAAATYRIYRAVEPEFRYEFLADLGQTLDYVDVLTATTWYAATSVDAGSESAFSDIVRIPLLVRPIQLVVHPATHELVALDQHLGALIHRDAAGDWIGRMGSQHLGLVGARGMSAGPDGLTSLAAGGRRILTLAEDRYPVAQFRLGTDEVNAEAYPGAVLLAGQTPRLDAPPSDDGRTLLLAPFDGNALAGQSAPAVEENLTFVDGRFGQAVGIRAGARLAYAPVTGQSPLFMPESGGLEFWLRPRWPGRDWVDHVLVDIGDGETYRFLIVKDAGAGLYVWVEDYDRHRAYAITDVRDWEAGEWRHLAVTWNAERLDLTLDGRLQDTQYWRHAITGTVSALWIGADRDGAYPADADFDALRISDFARWDRTDESRLVVANAGQHQLQVFDLLGNVISTYGEPGDGPGQFAQPIALAWTDPLEREALLVVESLNGRVQRLHFDGDNLNQPEIVATGFRAPAGVAVGPDGTLLVSDMALDTVSQVNDDGVVIAAWSGPNDGHAGAFTDPRGLAIGPDGSILVADGGNARIAAIQGVFPQTVYMPLLAHLAP